MNQSITNHYNLSNSKRKRFETDSKPQEIDQKNTTNLVDNNIDNQKLPSVDNNNNNNISTSSKNNSKLDASNATFKKTRNSSSKNIVVESDSKNIINSFNNVSVFQIFFFFMMLF
jgi:hypothetical protein